MSSSPNYNHIGELTSSETLFYEFAPQLKAARPELRIVDRLYDYRVGYINRHTGELARSVDACVADTHRIAEVHVEERGWEPEGYR